MKAAAAQGPSSRLFVSTRRVLSIVLACSAVSVWASGALGGRSSSALLALGTAERHTRAPASSASSELEWLGARINRDFRVRLGPARVRVYATHAAFARALWSTQRQRPQSTEDNSGGIVHGTLLLGPLPRSYLPHILAHVYSEWVMDRLSGNRSDRLPNGTWLYDGLAEYEAYRYAPAGMMCSGGFAPFDITTVRTAKRWSALRPGPLGSFEYCLAYLRVLRLVRRMGWTAIVGALRTREPWPLLAHRFQDVGQAPLTSRPGPSFPR